MKVTMVQGLPILRNFFTPRCAKHSMSLREIYIQSVTSLFILYVGKKPCLLVVYFVFSISSCALGWAKGKIIHFEKYGILHKLSVIGSCVVLLKVFVKLWHFKFWNQVLSCIWRERQCNPCSSLLLCRKCSGPELSLFLGRHSTASKAFHRHQLAVLQSGWM